VACDDVRQLFLENGVGYVVFGREDIWRTSQLFTMGRQAETVGGGVGNEIVLHVSLLGSAGCVNSHPLSTCSTRRNRAVGFSADQLLPAVYGTSTLCLAYRNSDAIRTGHPRSPDAVFVCRTVAAYRSAIIVFSDGSWRMCREALLRGTWLRGLTEKLRVDVMDMYSGQPPWATALH